MTTVPASPTNTGVLVSTACRAGVGTSFNHAEGVLVATALTGGEMGVALNHAEGIVAASHAAG